jgi:hypothetical protein
LITCLNAYRSTKSDEFIVETHKKLTPVDDGPALTSQHEEAIDKIERLLHSSRSSQHLTQIVDLLGTHSCFLLDCMHSFGLADLSSVIVSQFSIFSSHFEAPGLIELHQPLSNSLFLLSPDMNQFRAKKGITTISTYEASANACTATISSLIDNGFRRPIHLELATTFSRM